MGFKGISIVTRRGAANKPVIGFRGIVIALQLNLPVKVVDSKGRGLANAFVSLSNPTTAIPSTSFTDNQGNCLVNEDGSNPNPITVTLGKISKVVNYTGGAIITIVLENNKPIE